MDSLNANYPNSIKYIDNSFDSSSKLDSAFPGKIIFKSECYIKDPKNYNNINKINKENIQNESFSNFKDMTIINIAHKGQSLKMCNKIYDLNKKKFVK
mgnify:CR=1 FL=1